MMDKQVQCKSIFHLPCGPQTLHSAFLSKLTLTIDSPKLIHKVDSIVQSGQIDSAPELSSTSNKQYGDDPGDKPRSTDFLRWWLWEILCLLGSALSLAAIALILWHYDGEATPSWPAGIGINTVISIFSTLLKALMMVAVASCIGQLKWLWFRNPQPITDIALFESASGGPQGSLQLLLSSKIRDLAAVGAFVTCIAIAVDPFVQQSIRFYTCSFVDPKSQASIPIGITYAPVEALVQTLEFPMVGAIYDGIMNPNSNNTHLTAQCSTANCTFPTKYTTMGVCSACTNIAYSVLNEFQNSTFQVFNDTTELQVNVSQVIMNSSLPISYAVQYGSPPNGIPSIYQPFSMYSLAVPYPGAMQIITTPSAPTFAQSPSLEMAGMDLSDFVLFSYTKNSDCTADWMKGGPRQPETDCIVPSLVAGADNPALKCESDPFDKRLPCIDIDDWYNITASYCAISLCGQTYEGEVNEGVLDETLVSQSNLTQLAFPGWDEQDNTPLPNISYPSFIISPCFVNNTMYANILEYLNINITAAVHDNYMYNASEISSQLASNTAVMEYSYIESALASDPEKKALFDSCVFSGSPEAFSNIQSFFQSSFLHGNVTGATPAAGGSNGVADPGTNWATTDLLFNPIWLAPLYSSGNASFGSTKAVFDGLAQAMTNHIRQADANGTTVSGNVLASQTCVRIKWPWLILPAVLILFTGILLLATMYQTARNARMSAWKASPLALLFHGLSPETRADMGSLLSEDEMKAAAASKTVQLTKTPEGWRLVETR